MRSGALLAACVVATAVVIPCNAGVVRQITNETRVTFSGRSLDDAGTWVFASTTANLGGVNPLSTNQLGRWDAGSGAGSLLTTFPDGVHLDRFAASDDGQWVLLASRSNPVGTNADHSPELFLYRTDGNQTRQLTSSAAEASWFASWALAGSGNRVVFASRENLTGGNPSGKPQIFVVNADGTGLAQLTSNATDGDLDLSISDDGQRIAFVHAGNLTGGNADLSQELFVIRADGTGLRQMTSSTGELGGIWDPMIAGAGAKIVFDTREFLLPGASGITQVYVINWEGTGLRRVTNVGQPALDGANHPSVTDDGVTVVYASDRKTTGNPEGNSEIWKNRTDVSAEVQLTNTATGNFYPEISGGGGRIAFHASGPIGSVNLDGGSALVVTDGTGGTLRLLVDGNDVAVYSVDITADGSRAYFVSTSNVFGTNPGRLQQLFRVQTDGTGLAQLTATDDASLSYTWHTATTSDGAWVVFVSNGNLTGQNASNSPQIFAIRGDGTGLRQLTPESSGTNGIGGQASPAIAADGSWVVFQSVANYTGGNADGSAELFRVRTDGTGLGQVTNDNDTIYKLPRIDGSGTWVVFQSGVPSAVWRVRIDGTGLEKVTNFNAMEPDISDSGERIVVASAADPLGTNADGSSEIFLVEPGAGLVRQLTSAPSGGSARPRISGDGAWVYFRSTAPFFGPNPSSYSNAFRVPATGGAVERVDAFGSDLEGGSARYADFPVTNADGTKAAFPSRADPADTNPDGSSEVIFVDQSRVPALVVGAAAPTRVSWDAEPRPFRYDVIRGDVAHLAAGSGGSVDLGPVVCVENDSIDLDTEETDDPDQPAPGQVLFYLNRGSEGAYAGPGSYGLGSAGGERLPASGDCV